MLTALAERLLPTTYVEFPVALAVEVVSVIWRHTPEVVRDVVMDGIDRTEFPST